MSTTAMDAIPLSAIFAISFGLILLAAEIGYRLGELRHREREHENEPAVGGIVAAGLGLLAFLLAFTFGIAAARFESRRHVLLEESNAIGTTFLRSQVLSEPEGSQIRVLLREYVDVRLAAVEEGTLDAGLRRSEELHKQLWDATVAAAKKEPRSIPTGLFMQSMNDVIDLHAERLFVALRSRIPLNIWGVLLAVALLSFGSIGYQSGLTGVRRSPAVLPLALIFAAAIWVVVDLDRPQEGLLRVSQQPLIDLRATMDEGNP